MVYNIVKEEIENMTLTYAMNNEKIIGYLNGHGDRTFFMYVYSEVLGEVYVIFPGYREKGTVEMTIEKGNMEEMMNKHKLKAVKAFDTWKECYKWLSEDEN